MYFMSVIYNRITLIINTMTSPLDTRHWKFYLSGGFKPKQLQTKDCDYCGGRGTIGGGFKSIDGPETCPTCYGSKCVEVEERDPIPEIPPELVENLKKTVADYYEKLKSKT